jgi:hypothetical protein
MSYDDDYHDRHDEWAREQRNDELDRDLERRAEHFKEDQEYDRRKREQEMDDAVELVNRGEVEAAAITLGFDIPRAAAALPVDAAGMAVRLQQEMHDHLARVAADPTLSGPDKDFLGMSYEAMYLERIARWLQSAGAETELAAVTRRRDRLMRQMGRKTEERTP